MKAIEGELIVALVITLVIIIFVVKVMWEFWFATKHYGRFMCKMGYTFAGIPQFFYKQFGGGVTYLFTGFGALTGYKAGTVAAELVRMASSKYAKVAYLVQAAYIAVGAWAGYETGQQMSLALLSYAEKIVDGMCKCEFVDFSKKKPNCLIIRKLFNKTIYDALENAIGRCDMNNPTWRKIYYQTMIAYYVVKTYDEMGYTYFEHTHYILYFPNESMAGPFTEKDLDVYLYAINDPYGFPMYNDINNLHDFAVDTKTQSIVYVKRPCYSFLCTSTTLKYIVDDDEKFICPSMNYKKCYREDTILMRRFDDLKDTNKPILIIIANLGVGRIGVTKCYILNKYGEVKCS